MLFISIYFVGIWEKEIFKTNFENPIYLKRQTSSTFFETNEFFFVCV